MSRSGCLAVFLMVFLLTGGVLTWLMKSRASSERLMCLNNLRVISMTGSPFVRDEQGIPRPMNVDPLGRLVREVNDAVWSGTVVNPALKPEQRLSWYVFAMPGLSEKRQPLEDLEASLDRKSAWDAEAHATAKATPIKSLICPGSASAGLAASPAVTHYVGVAGLGLDAATIELGMPISKRAGAYRYDSSTPYTAFVDGLSNTLLLGESTAQPGPWLQGGPSTVKGIDDSQNLSPIGRDRAFHSEHTGGCYFAFADGSGRFFTVRTTPKILYAMATIAGGANEAIEPD